MSHPQPTPASSPDFQLIFTNALKAYEKRTKRDLLAHPLAAQLQDCDSPSAILAVIHQQLEGLHQSQRADERLTKWLDPTINILFAFSGALGEGVGLVSLWIGTYLMFTLSYLLSRRSHLQRLSLLVSVCFFQCAPFFMHARWML
jgi:hypothetical protein